MNSAVKLLAIDTATEQCSVALLHGAALFERCVRTPRGHADMVLPMVQEVMSEAGLGFTQLDAIAFGRGPGAFTGVRMAIGVAQGLAYAADLPLLPVSDLAAVAQQVAASLSAGAHMLVCMDARMGEVYSGQFVLTADGLVSPVAAERVCPPEHIDTAANELAMGAGTGFRAYPVLSARYAGLPLLDDILPRAVEIVRLGLRGWRAGLAVNAELAAPVYLRDQVVHVKAP
ncbi:MAG: tRNA (adenosine(37)-N6)-threonylcarbamoyltransferase complex dimerization subunit type 1 TsaB [Steroidobacteraceae bacterium]